MDLLPISLRNGEHCEPPDVDRLVSGYLMAWNEPDANRRLRRLQTVWSERGRYESACEQVVGIRAMNDYIAAVHAAHAGCRFELRSVIAHHRQLHLSWSLLEAAGREAFGGFDCVDLDDAGRIERLVTYWRSAAWC